MQGSDNKIHIDRRTFTRYKKSLRYFELGSQANTISRYTNLLFSLSGQMFSEARHAATRSIPVLVIPASSSRL